MRAVTAVIISYYLRQNLLQIPLITPNYMNGCRGFRDYDLGGEAGQIESDVYLFNEANPRGDHKGIACVALSIVDGGGRLVKHFSYPRPAPGDWGTEDLRSLEDMIETAVYSEAGDTSPGPGPMALVQFRVWESGRLDLERSGDYSGKISD